MGVSDPVERGFAEQERPGKQAFDTALKCWRAVESGTRRHIEGNQGHPGVILRMWLYA